MDSKQWDRIRCVYDLHPDARYNRVYSDEDHEQASDICGLPSMLPPRLIDQLTAKSCAQNIALIVSTIIALPVGMANKRNDGHFIFATVENLTTWPTGWAFMLAWLSPIWTIGAFDSCVHMSEEASNAAKAVPLGILSSIGMCWGLGFVIVIVLAACIDPNIENVLGSSFGQPVSNLLVFLGMKWFTTLMVSLQMAQIYYDALGKQGAMGFIAFLFIVQYLMGYSITIAASRQMWAFSRDGALPFSSFFRRIVSFLLIEVCQNPASSNIDCSPKPLAISHSERSGALYLLLSYWASYA